jgi:hypothetical protein
MSKMRNINQAIVKWVSYVFFILLAGLLILTFGVPSITQNMNTNSQSMAVINGQEVTNYDFLIFLNTDPQYAGRINEINSDEALRNRAINVFIRRVLSVQYAEKIGIKAPKEQVLDYIRESFRDESGKYSQEQLDNYLNYFNISFDQFYKRATETVLVSELNNLIIHGAGQSPDEILMEKRVRNSKIEIEYALFSVEKIRAQYADEIAVTDAEIEAELAKDTEDDANTQNRTKESVRSQLDRQKINELKVKLLDQIQTGNDFETALELWQIEPQKSKPFSIGEPVFEDGPENAILFELYSDPVFYEDCLSTNIGKLARPISAASGIYVYTVREKSVGTPSQDEITDTDISRVMSVTGSVTQNQLLDMYFENAKIVRNYQNTENK